MGRGGGRVGVAAAKFIDLVLSGLIMIDRVIAMFIFFLGDLSRAGG